MDAVAAHSPEQSQVLQLAHILDGRSVLQGSQAEDWLEADLSHVLHAPDATEDLRARVRDLKTWWDTPYTLMALSAQLKASWRVPAPGPLEFGC